MIKNIMTVGLTILLLTISEKGISQISTSFYNSANTKIGVGYNFGEKMWSEIRLSSESDFSIISPEVNVFYNIKRNQIRNIYMGVGANMTDYSGVGILLPVGVQILPFTNLNTLSFNIELVPVLDTDIELHMASSWGIRYVFGKRSVDDN